MTSNKEIILDTVKEPACFPNVPPTFLTDKTMNERKTKVLKAMKKEGFQIVAIYADKEHGSNFEYLTGFIPRFEEGLLLIEDSGKCTVILGNENLKMAAYSRAAVTLKHSPLFSLPNQPMDNEAALEEILQEAGLDQKNKIGLVGWKMFTTQKSDPSTYFDLPYFIVEAFKKAKRSDAELVNAAHLFIGGDFGVRTTNNANEIAHYEYGANLASTCMLRAMNEVETGRTEAEIGDRLTAEGQYNTVVTIAAAGQRFDKANFYPTHKKIQLGDPLSLTTGFKGGLSSRTGFVIESEKQLPSAQKDYLDRVAKPYYSAVVSWLETIRIGMKGGELYRLIENVFPKNKYHWHLNPGHLVADEEWMSSPIYEESTEILKSGMIFQLDIIPSIPGYTGVSAEECVAIADQPLQDEIKRHYPGLWQRMTTRRNYIENELNIQLSKDVLPLSNTAAYLRPFFLAKSQAFVVRK
ncbi:Xaa-Pro peptidase family protein [Paenibacillus sp. UNC499MF]|uniref:M24 family metallopeptidase n=1 Tax=Paenibacillus sp. UNC499MF TaxID=1502751 RepID=UPI00089F9CCE|nr:M24 family metallopeptidase [Paenibacillus sp. UNC499MF]SEG59559.1 Xaa-Pro aminopeptidase [Paenibacillus sp. UNC499MF]